MKPWLPKPRGLAISELVNAARKQYGIEISPEQIQAIRERIRKMREPIEREDEERPEPVGERWIVKNRPEPVGERWIVKNRKDAFASVDSFGLIWTVYLPSALAFTSEGAALQWIARSFHEPEISAHGIAPLDVSTWPTRPLRALGDVR